MSPRSPEESARLGAAFRKGLNETGTIEGQNVTVEYHWLSGQFERLSSLMADLVRRRLAVIATPAFTAAARRPKPRPRRSRSSSASPKTRSSWVWSPALPGRAAMRPASIFWPPKLWPSDWVCCTTWCQGGSCCRTDQSGQCADRRGHPARHTGSGPRPRTANYGPQRQHQSVIN
jgi:hypothetical protein